MEAMEAYASGIPLASTSKDEDDEDDQLLNLGDEVDHLNPIHLSADILLRHFYVLNRSRQYSVGMSYIPNRIQISEIINYFKNVVNGLYLVCLNNYIFQLDIFFFIDIIQELDIVTINKEFQDMEKKREKEKIPKKK